MKWLCVIVLGLLMGLVAQAQGEGSSTPIVLNQDERFHAFYETGDSAVALGEHLDLRLTVRAPAPLDADSIPDFPNDGDVFEVLSASEPNIRQNGDWVFERDYRIVLWQIGQYTTPEQLIPLPNGQFLPIQSVTWLVMSQLPTEGDVTLRPNFGVRDLPYTPAWVFMALVGGVVVLVATGIWWLERSIRGKRGGIEEQLAQDAIDDLLGLGGQTLESDLIFALIANRLRRYVEERRGIPATELTTDELQSFLQDEGRMTRPTRQPLIRILEQADLVKFAQFTPDGEAISKVIEFAVRWIRAHEDELKRQAKNIDEGERRNG